MEEFEGMAVAENKLISDNTFFGHGSGNWTEMFNVPMEDVISMVDELDDNGRYWRNVDAKTQEWNTNHRTDIFFTEDPIK